MAQYGPPLCHRISQKIYSDRYLTGENVVKRDSVTVRRTQEERKAETRRRLLAAAAALFAEHGVDGVSVDAVADAAGRTSGAVYAHFGSKQGMLVALLDEWRHLLVTVVTGVFDEAADLGERLRAVAETVIVNPSDDTRRLLALERELTRLAGRDPSIAAVLRARAADAQKRMSRGFRAWMEAGLVPPGDPDALAAAFRALVIGIELQQRLDPVLDVDQVATLLHLVVGNGTHLAGAPGLRQNTPTAIATTRSA
jgi:AcrR family transcriptional regulator